ncbi:condensation domain-containing protein [Coxiella burnetii]|nr:condensation domain-containing protein [Coxiella burnetii]
MGKSLSITPYQQLFWLEWMLDPKSTRYNLALSFKLEGPFQASLFREAIEQIIKSNEALRAIASEDGKRIFFLNFL